MSVTLQLSETSLVLLDICVQYTTLTAVISEISALNLPRQRNTRFARYVGSLRSITASQVVVASLPHPRPTPQAGRSSYVARVVGWRSASRLTLVPISLGTASLWRSLRSCAIRYAARFARIWSVPLASLASDARCAPRSCYGQPAAALWSARACLRFG
jgi:hypothetical protein